MKNWLALAALLVATLWSQFAAGQSSNPATPGAGITGTGPRVEVRTSPNGTLDVGGARGSDLDLTGENFRGSFGASRPQSTNPPGGGLPASSFPGSGRRPLGSPNFGPSMPGGSARFDESAASDQDNGVVLSDLILPRFRGNLGRSNLGSRALPSSAQHQPTDNWRYQFFRGRWWYWQPDHAWVYWDGSQWRNYSQ